MTLVKLPLIQVSKFFRRQNRIKPSFNELQRLSIEAQRVVKNYYENIDAENLDAAVFGFFAKHSVYIRNFKELLGLSNNLNSIASFYREVRNIKGNHKFNNVENPQFDVFRELYKKEVGTELPYKLDIYLRRSLIPIYVQGSFRGTDGEGKEIELNFSDFHLFDPNSGKVVFRQSVVKDLSDRLLGV